LRWRRSPVFERFYRFHFSILFWKGSADFLDFGTAKRDLEALRKGKADRRGRLPSSISSGKNNACKRKRRTFGPSPQTTRRNERLHENGEARLYLTAKQPVESNLPAPTASHSVPQRFPVP